MKGLCATGGCVGGIGSEVRRKGREEDDDDDEEEEEGQ